MIWYQERQLVTPDRVYNEYCCKKTAVCCIPAPGTEAEAAEVIDAGKPGISESSIAMPPKRAWIRLQKTSSGFRAAAVAGYCNSLDMPLNNDHRFHE